MYHNIWWRAISYLESLRTLGETSDSDQWQGERRLWIRDWCRHKWRQLPSKSAHGCFVMLWILLSIQQISRQTSHFQKTEDQIVKHTSGHRFCTRMNPQKRSAVSFSLSLPGSQLHALLTSKSFVPCVHWYVQRALSQPVASQEFTSMLQLLRFAFRVCFVVM